MGGYRLGRTCFTGWIFNRTCLQAEYSTRSRVLSKTLEMSKTCVILVIKLII